MSLRDIFIISKGTKVVLLITLLVSVAAIAAAIIYYSSVNLSEDPRIEKARMILDRYDRESDRYDLSYRFRLLDSADAVFNSLPEYSGSFERGVILNNRCSALLMSALYDSSVTVSEKNNILELAMSYADSSIALYRRWIREWGKLTRNQVEERVRDEMETDHPRLEGRNIEKIISRRIDNQVIAQTETPRRLSVSISNRGIIFRHLMQPDSALACFTDALLLWKDNRVAKSNLSILMGGEPVTPGLIESLFPPDRKKK